MKTLLLVSIIASMLCMLGVVIGNPEYPILSRVCFLLLGILFFLLSKGIEKRKLYGWWAGSGIFLFLVATAVMEVFSAVFEWKNISDLLVRGVGTAISGVLFGLLYYKFWQPRKSDYFLLEPEDTEPVAGGDAAR